MTETIDIIDHLLGIKPGSRGDTLRNRRPITKENAQRSWLALFSPKDESEVSLTERFAIATFVAALHGEWKVAEFYAGKLSQTETGATLLPLVKAAADTIKASGPYGHYPSGPLSQEDVAGPTLHLSDVERKALTPRLAAALEHAHLLVLHPRDAEPAHLQKLLSAGWSATGVVTLSQLVSFLAFQIRVVAGLKVLAA
ncbi:CMD domain protein [Agrobacterium tumefaciens]|uniref:CMD domain protein n=1 Tax=Agrobacterium tumefaciens TaxID=358 RepID=UPI0021D33724|nr:CMD domain protein [Agrobacterium tumefaciens]UXS04757.1 CMD domain protein [Agrobacterium tumefaciens]